MESINNQMPLEKEARPTAAPTLYVDVDGTLIRTDLLVESALRLVFRNPLYFFALLVWCARGKAVLKYEISRRVALDYQALPYSSAFMAWLKTESASGRKVILASASSEKYVQGIAAYLGLPADVLGSTPKHNMAGQNKLEAIQAHALGKAFDYAGNAPPDLFVWTAARHAIVVNPTRGLEAAARNIATVEIVFRTPSRTLRTWVKGLRLHQWIKNCLLAVPLFTSFQFLIVDSLIKILLAIVAFGLVASATYLVNDLADLDSDRMHPRKCKRALAAGDIGILQGIFAGFVLLIVGFSLAAWVSLYFMVTVGIYLVATLTYSLKLKKFMLIDVLCLAGLYTWRIVAGAAALDVEVSNWLAAFSLFIFFSLALVKRCAELLSLSAQSKVATKGRDYRTSDNSTLTAMGVAAGFLAVLVMALFIDTPSTAAHYSTPRLLWLLCPLLLYWVGRLWIKTGRGEMHDDPIVYSARDRASWVVFGCFVIITVLAR